jgi:hypothetical protein
VNDLFNILFASILLKGIDLQLSLYVISVSGFGIREIWTL